MAKTYRPCLTAEDISTILALVEPRKDSGVGLWNIYQKLVPFKAKISIGAVKSIGEARKNIAEAEDSFGFSASEKFERRKELSPTEKRASAYEKWCSSPEDCSAYELELVETYRFENALMSGEELEKLNARVLGI